MRAEFAIELRRVEVALEKAKDKAARELVEANKRRVEISEINTELEGIKGRLQEKENANRVLEQTIRRRSARARRPAQSREGGDGRA